MRTKMTSLLALLLLGGCLPSIAQKSVFAPIGAKWHYGIRYSNASPEEYYRSIEYTKDTVINTKSCAVLEIANHYTKNEKSIIGYKYLNQEAQKVYLWDADDQDFLLLYDFSLNAGESWVVKGKNCSVTINVNSVENINLSGISLKSLHISSDHVPFYCTESHFFQRVITERISMEDFLFWYRFVPGLDMDIPDFRCYSDNLIQFQVSGSKACDYITSTNDTEADKALSFELKDKRIYFTNAELSGIKASIYNISGLCITNTCVSMDNNIDITNVAPGIYFLKLLYADQSKTFKFVIP